jgi:hypothetical protein
MGLRLLVLVPTSQGNLHLLKFYTLACQDSPTQNSNNKLNATLGLTHLQYNVQHEKIIRFFFVLAQ